MMSAPEARTSPGFIALTVAAVPTGMKAGVRISPRCMVIAPVRAAPSVAAMEKANRVMMARVLAPLRGRGYRRRHDRPVDNRRLDGDRRADRLYRCHCRRRR